MNQNNKTLSYRDPNVIKELAEKDKRIEDLESEVKLLLSITNLMMNVQGRGIVSLEEVEVAFDM